MDRTRLGRDAIALLGAVWLGLGTHASADVDPLTGAEPWRTFPGSAAEEEETSGADRGLRGAAPAPGALYATSGTALYTIDKATGVSTLVGSHGTVSFAIGGMAFDSDGELYGFDLKFDAGSTASLYSIDPATGAKVLVGSLGVGFVFEGALAIGPTHRFFGANQNNSTAARLFESNPATGEAWLVGPDSGEVRDLNGLTFDGATLFALDRVSNTLGVVDLVTGEYEEVGAVGATVGFNGGLALDPASGTLYAAIGSTGPGEPSDLYVLDKETGAGTFVANMSIEVFDLAFAPPEPRVHLFGDSFETGEELRWGVSSD
jgi:hypothetical protein